MLLIVGPGFGRTVVGIVAVKLLQTILSTSREPVELIWFKFLVIITVVVNTHLCDSVLT